MASVWTEAAHRFAGPVPDPVRLCGYFTKGLGDLVVAEAAELVPGLRVVAVRDRYTLLDVPTSALDTLIGRSRTIDDLRLLLAGPQAIGDETAFVDMLREAGRRTREALGPDRIAAGPWSVTLSARNPIWRRRPHWSPDDAIKAALPGVDPAATARSPVDLRIQVDGGDTHISLNLTPHPIGKRADPGPSTRPGALRPTVAAAMVRAALANADPEVSARGVYDPFCGSGTILIEARRQGLHVAGSDLDPEAVELTRRRLGDGAGSDPGTSRLFHHDVRAGSPRRPTADLVVGNLPWGKQIDLPRRGELFAGVAELLAGPIGRGGCGVLLSTSEQQLVASLKRRNPDARIDIRRIGLLGQTPAIVVVRGRTTFSVEPNRTRERR